MSKVIITAALTGAITLPSQTPYLPITPEQLADEAARSREAGAAIAHLHARNPVDGRPTADQEIFGEILQRIKEKTDIIVCTTTGGSPEMSIEERVAVVPKYKPEMASFNMGSINFSLHPLLERIKEYKYDWEKVYLEKSRDFVFRNTFEDHVYIAKASKAANTKPEYEIYDVGHLYSLKQLVRDGLADKPFHLQFVMGVLGGIQPTAEDLLHLKRIADKLFTTDYTWSVIGVGYPAQFNIGVLALVMGGHVRVGLEDNTRISKTELAKSNAALVAKISRIAKELNREPMTPNEARNYLGLKGIKEVGY